MDFGRSQKVAWLLTEVIDALPKRNGFYARQTAASSLGMAQKYQAVGRGNTTAHETCSGRCSPGRTVPQGRFSGTNPLLKALDSHKPSSSDWKSSGW